MNGRERDPFVEYLRQCEVLVRTFNRGWHAVDAQVLHECHDPLFHVVRRRVKWPQT